MSNNLAYEKSPYLLQHSNNPVNWYPWVDEAFRKAVEYDKPVFLSIGYSTCHWCHVMAHESFEDTTAAAVLNRDFISIKVDREERPDIDSVYMDVCQALTGSGGWPLTIIMTPEKKPFFAGTYFPKDDRLGHPGLINILRRIAHLWKTDRSSLLEAGEEITAALEENSNSPSLDPDISLIHRASSLFHRSFDPHWGGFGSAPKFPAPHNLLFLLAYSQTEHDLSSLEIVKTTLSKMAEGGIFDHIGGGFSRYSTDSKWLIPHFEKMLYDNALLLITYLTAFQLTKAPVYSDIARRTAEYILREMYSPQGGFFCGQDADSDGIEGKYYVFTPADVINALGKDDGHKFCHIYNISETPNFEAGSVPNRIGSSLPPLLPEDPILSKMYNYRLSRTSLHTDDKILLSWSSLAIIAMSMAGAILDEPRFLNAANQTQQFIEKNMTDSSNRLLLRYRDGEATNKGQLSDYAFYCLALLSLYQATFDPEYLKSATYRAWQMDEYFEDKRHGGFFINAHDSEQLIMRPKETYDGAVPSGNSAAAMALEALANLTGDLNLRKSADRQHRFMAGQAENCPSGSSFWLLSLIRALRPGKELICASNSFPAELMEYLKNNPANDLSILYKSEENSNLLSQCAPFTASYPVPETGTLWYLCKNGACMSPETDFSRLDL